MNEPAHALRCQRMLAIPQKRSQKTTIEFLQREEIEALVAAPDPSTWLGRRDRTLLLLMVQTGLRVSELTSLRREQRPGRWRARAMRGQGPQEPLHAAAPRRGCGARAWLDEQRPAPGVPSSRVPAVAG